MPTLLIPNSLAQYANNNKKINLPASTVKDLLIAASAQYKNLAPYLLDTNGQLNAFVGYFLNSKLNIRQLSGIETPLTEQDKLIILTATAGG